ncbi:MAG: histidinol-phosphatase [Clostridia bacterium]|nr:histidinol-phosphatase [Clostridia bacterium]
MQMIMNLHTHTFRCRHASGTEREYIENALAAGLTTLGFSDHVPYPFPNGHRSGFRMDCEQMDDYVDTLLLLREEYKDRIDIKIGYEAEYYPAVFDDMLALVTSREIDYLILGQHFLRNEYDGGLYAGREHDAEMLAEYVDQLIEGLGTGVYTYVAHPDLFRCTCTDEIYEKEFGRLIEYAKNAGIPLEINLLGIRDNRHYPTERFFRLCGEIGAQVVLGCDAHSPDVTADLVSFEKALAMAEKYGAQVNLTPKLVPVKKRT